MAGIEQARQLLRETFGYSDFRYNQEEIIRALLAGEDALTLMPTGGGKSLCYQIPALLRQGVGVVISPLIALMQDQVDALRQLGISAAFLNSSLDAASRRATEQALLNSELKLLYIAPERLLMGRCWNCWSACQSPSLPSTRPTASHSGDTTSAKSTNG